MRRVKDRRTLDDGRYVEVRFDSNPYQQYARNPYQQYARTVRFLRRLWPGRAKPKRDDADLVRSALTRKEDD
jgi:hypothetical protein